MSKPSAEHLGDWAHHVVVRYGPSCSCCSDTPRSKRGRSAHARVQAYAGEHQSLDARLDAQEAAVEAVKRDEGSRMKLELKTNYDKMRRLTLHNKKSGAESSRERRTRALERAAQQQALLKRLAADEKRAEAKAWLLERRHNESMHLQRAAMYKQNVATTRANARSMQEHTLQSRKREAMKERANDVLVDQEKARILAANKELVAYTYRSKFATHKEANEWGASTLLQFRSDYFGRGDPVFGEDGEPPLALPPPAQLQPPVTPSSASALPMSPQPMSPPPMSPPDVSSGPASPSNVS